MKLRHCCLLVLSVFVATTLRADCPFGFLPASHYSAGGSQPPTGVTAGDFNGDGYVDVAILNGLNKTINILLGGPGGVFSQRSQISTDQINELLTVDVNNDGKLDLAGSSPARNSRVFPQVFPHLQVFHGNGDGTFVAVVPDVGEYIDQNPFYMALGDFDNNGRIDIAATKDKGTQGAAATTQIVSMRNFLGMFLTPKDFQPLSVSDAIAGGIAVGDFDGDGKLDLAVSETPVVLPASRQVSIYYGLGDGTFVRSANTIVVTTGNTNPKALQAADFNGDGMSDLAIVMKDDNNFTYPSLKIALSNGAARTFAAPVVYGNIEAGGQVLIKDIDGDGKLDVLVAGSRGVNVFPGNGDGTFGVQRIIGSFMQRLAIDDFDHDGGLDIASTSATTAIDVMLNTCGRVTVNLTSSANPAPQGTPITISGTVISPPAVAATGTLTLKRGSTVLASGNLNAGTVVFTLNDLAPGAYLITAEYSGDSRFVSALMTIHQVVTEPPVRPPPGVNAISFGGPVQVAWIATANTNHYEISRNYGAGWVVVGTSLIASFTDSLAPPTAAILYRVRAFTAGGVASEYSAPDLALTYTFTDGTLQAGVTSVKRVHLTELREAANAVRALAPLSAMSWAEATPDIIRAAHLVELRTAIDQARAALYLPALPHADSTLNAGSTLIRAIHFEELRAAMR